MGEGRVRVRNYRVTPVVAYAAVTVPNTFSSGTTISSSQVNANFTALGNAMPAVKTASLGASATLTGSYSNVGSLTVTAPTAGFVQLTATGMAEILGKTNAGYFFLYVGLTDTSSGIPAEGNFTRFYLTDTATPAAVTANYNIPYSVHSVFPVAAGANTFYLVALETGSPSGGSGRLWYNRITAIFVPGTALP
ncbi:MAG: hypothetical protein HZC10_04930 [Nitrospirae bacterium]|nr:hypothetical protein [Nitrospirota bacterium]